VYHLHLTQGYQGRKQSVIDGWKELMGEDLKIINRREDVSNIITKTILSNYEQAGFLSSDDVEINMDKPIEPITDKPDDEEEIIL
jgi:hypothetical protein